MRASLYLLLWISLNAIAFAQDFPRWEAFLGYSQQLTDVSRSTLRLHGGHLSITENINPWFGGTLDISGNLRKENGTIVDTQTITYGPQFTLRKLGPIAPSARVGLGIVRTSPGFLGVAPSRIDFAVATGGALDIGLGRNVALRVLQADWIGTRFQDPSPRYNLRLSTGLVFRCCYGWRWPF